jgi:hypothetical protein
MQFIKNGPDIPESLLQAHEDGRVVFFCGAGISYPAGLPGFQGLVDQIYSELGATRTVIEEQAYSKEQYDATLDLLERRIPGQRATVRAALARVLQPNLRKKGATTTHAALLQLARDRSNNVRLVTTNFDRIFLHVMARIKPVIPCYLAPLLPIPKNSRWNGVVYLHGVLPKTSDESALNRLVISSGDFGLAYLTERWAARFVSELFRNYIVCFIGYSINDPVLRYMMDALAADKMLGELTPQAYAFGSYSTGEEDQALVEWAAKGVTPVLYEVPSGTHDHSSFHRTLKEWADTHRDGVLGKERIVAQYAVNPPMASTCEDNFIGRILWAISDKSSLPAKRFANLDPVPPLAWLEPLAQNLFKQAALPRFGVPPKTEKDDKLSFSLVRRPSPYTHAPMMVLVNAGGRDSQWDEVMIQVASWLLRHLDDHELILWITKNGGQLHDQFAWMIRNHIKELDRLAKEDKHNELDRIRASAPAAIPRPIIRTLWCLLLSGRVKSRAYRADLYDWMSRLKQDGLTPTLRLELREILSPCVSLSESFRWDGEEAHDSKPERIGDLVRWEVVLNTEHPHSALRDWQDKYYWQQALPELMQDFSMLLRDTLDLSHELGGADDRSDHSYVDQPSIDDHPQNKSFHDWTVLIELTRDAWVATAKLSDDRARLAAESWWYTPYPVFKRLALFAAAQGSMISSERALEWLLSEDAWWLWSEEVRRETMRLLVVLASKLDVAGISELERAILKGPPREMFRDDIESESWSHIVDRVVWLRLAKIQSEGAKLSSDSQARLENISKKNPQWQLTTNESDEFPFWMESGSGVDNDPLRKFLVAPRRRVDLVAWLKQHPCSDYWQDDDWRSRCSDSFSSTSCALLVLTREGEWPADRWREALQAWAEDKLLKRSWRYMAPVLANAPDDLVQKCMHSISWWLQAIAKTFGGHEELFLGLSKRILAFDLEDGASTNDPVFQAINHPVGHVTEALLSWWYRHSLQDGQGLLDSIKPVLTRLCDTHINKFRHGRVILAAHTIALFRVDDVWAIKYLLPLFDWQQSETEARSAWEGFLRSPRLYRPLLEAIKQPMLATATHYAQLGDHARQYADFLTFAALELGDTFSAKEFEQATSALPPEGLHHAAQALARALEGPGEQRREYWNNRIRPYLKSVWPKSRDKILPSIAESLAQLCVAADEAFPDALAELKNWLIPIDHPDYVIHLLYQSKLPQRFPEAALDFMDRIISDSTQWPPTDLKECLQVIPKASPNLLNDARYLRLSEYLRRHGRE